MTESPNVGIKESFFKKIEAVKHPDILAGVKKKLADNKHPYGLLLMSTPLLMASTGSQITGPALSSSSSIVDSSSITEKGTPGKFVRDLSSAGFLGLASSGESPAVSLVSTGLALSSSADGEDNMHGLAALFSSVLGSSAAVDPQLAHLFEQSFVYKDAQLGFLLSPSLNKDVQESGPNVVVGKDKIKAGAVSANVFVYSGKTEYQISGDNLEQTQVVKPNDKFLAIHVNSNPSQYKDMKPLEKIKNIQKDFRLLCDLLQNPQNHNLTPENVALLSSLKDAPIIGVSHLVRLLDVKKAPTWNISLLPKFFQKFHTFDSQIVSKIFGGQRKVETSDIKVMFLPASMRSIV